MLRISAKPCIGALQGAYMHAHVQEIHAVYTVIPYPVKLGYHVHYADTPESVIPLGTGLG